MAANLPSSLPVHSRPVFEKGKQAMKGKGNEGQGQGRERATKGKGKRKKGGKEPVGQGKALWAKRAMVDGWEEKGVARHAE